MKQFHWAQLFAQLAMTLLLGVAIGAPAQAVEGAHADLTGAQADMCRAPTGDCRFYLNCLEDQIQCGPSGYPIGYGFKYCEKFSAETRLSLQGKAWMTRTRQCLQKSLLPYVNQEGDVQKCSQLMEDAFDSHPRCYTLKESSICHLSIPDVLLICQTIGGADLLSFRGLKQMDAVAKTCVFNLQGERATPAIGAGTSSASPMDGGQLRHQLESEPESDESLKSRIEFWKSFF